jgi:DNA polymerase/3'-5' exonuclease PolX
MVEKLDEKEPVGFEELIRANMIQTDAAAQLYTEKGIITEEEFYTKLKQG